jgi:DNA sulfur modification protein DndD
MRLVRAHIEHFKLLEDIKVDFSTDADKPLTVIRAENGAGKTTLLYALLWAFYGMEGLPGEARGLRLTSSAEPAGIPVDVSAMVEFEHTDDNSDITRYRLIRSVVETPGIGDKVDRPAHEAPPRLLRITKAGEEDIPDAEALIGKLIPPHLRDVFFTNGEQVQTFISRVSSQVRQDKVHKSIKLLLGLDEMRIAADDLESVFRRLRQGAAKSGGSDTLALASTLDKTNAELAAKKNEAEKLAERIANMTEQKAKWDRELTGLRGIGDLDELNDRIEKAERAAEAQERSRHAALVRMRNAVRSEACSWALMGENLEKGMAILSGLADRNVIPGTSVEVLTDRLDLETCICGEPLTAGSEHRSRVEALRDDQLRVDENRQRLTALLHTSRHAKASEDARISQDGDFAARRKQALGEFTEARDLLALTAGNVDQWKERRKLIDHDRVRYLTESLEKIEAQAGGAQSELGGILARIDVLNGRRQEQDARLDDAEKAARVSGDLILKQGVARDLVTLAEGTLKVLEGDYVRRVSDRMNDLFMTIVGSHPDFEAGVFQGVHIDDSFNIVVDTAKGRSLDPDFELNGASQRALTLAYIWALMEVSGTTAPRIIDTPLGMVAGGVKTRMVDAITKPTHAELPDFQVILLLTRSEIRDVEELLDERAGVVRTLSCSKDYPVDLTYSWEVDHPTTRMCSCNHRQSCQICARKYDARHGIEFRDMEALV